MLVAERNYRPAVAGIVALSVAAIAFLLWLLYVHKAPAEYAARFNFLPGLNALLNALSATALVAGIHFIRRRNVPAHRALMTMAFSFSTLFLCSYILNHTIHGETSFPGHGTPRGIYLTILITHVLLSIVALPLVLSTFFFAITGGLRQHRKIARITFPIWLYVSVTGVVVYGMLTAYR